MIILHSFNKYLLSIYTLPSLKYTVFKKMYIEFIIFKDNFKNKQINLSLQLVKRAIMKNFRVLWMVNTVDLVYARRPEKVSLSGPELKWKEEKFSVRWRARWRVFQTQQIICARALRQKEAWSIRMEWKRQKINLEWYQMPNDAGPYKFKLEDLTYILNTVGN